MKHQLATQSASLSLAVSILASFVLLIPERGHAQDLPDLITWGPAASPRIQTVTFSSSSCAVVEGMVQAGTRKLLRFTTETRNQGTADIYLGNPATNPQFVYAPCHGHYHFNNYAHYGLLDSNGQEVAT